MPNKTNNIKYILSDISRGITHLRRKGSQQEESLPYSSSVNIYPCDFCGKIFSCHSWFQRHVKIHTGQKDWVCQHCDKAFIRKDHLKVHVWSKHTEKMQL